MNENDKETLKHFGIIMLAALAGGILGAWLLSGLKSNTAKILFAVILVAGGIKMLF